MIQLIANPQAYDGKTVRIIGFLHLEFEGNVIYLHNEDFRHGLTKNGLWIEIPKDMTKEQMKAVNDQYVICTARFVAKMHGHMGMNSGEVANVTRLEVLARIPRSTSSSSPEAQVEVNAIKTTFIAEPLTFISREVGVFGKNGLARPVRGSSADCSPFSGPLDC